MTDTQDGPTYPDVHVDLSGQDGNAFAIVARTQKAIRRVHGAIAADSFAEAAMGTGSYDELLQVVMATVEVS